jgi:hypothetical protein
MTYESVSSSEEDEHGVYGLNNWVLVRVKSVDDHPPFIPITPFIYPIIQTLNRLE